LIRGSEGRPEVQTLLIFFFEFFFFFGCGGRLISLLEFFWRVFCLVRKLCEDGSLDKKIRDGTLDTRFLRAACLANLQGSVGLLLRAFTTIAPRLGVA
jgi:hypothetical protein